MKKELFIFVLLCCINCIAQDSIVIHGTLHNNSRYAKVIINQFNIGSFPIAAVPIVNQEFSVKAPPTLAPGVYRLQYSQTTNEYVDIIINGKESTIEFTLDLAQESSQRTPVFVKSNENKAWQLFEQERKKLLKQLQVLDDFANTYPEHEAKIFKKIKAERARKIKKYFKDKATFMATTPHYYAKQMAAFTPSYFPDPTLDWRIQEMYSFNNFWQGKPTHDTSLLNTPLYQDAILNYIQYYLNPAKGFNEEEINQGFKKCVDSIINKFSGNEETREFAIRYLQLGFKDLGNEILLQYTDEKYAVQNQCTANDPELLKRLQSYKALKEGTLAPDIDFKKGVLSLGPTTVSKFENLYSLKTNQLVLVFWASWCPHCMEELPKLNIWAKENPDSHIVAISLDDDISAFETAIKPFNNLYHYCDFLKWNTKSAQDYYIEATPTLFLLDSDKKIKGKYSSTAQLVDGISSLKPQ